MRWVAHLEGIPLPAEPVRTRLDGGEAAWANRARWQVEGTADAELLRLTLRGIAYTVAEAVPDEVWRTLAAARAIMGRAPSLLLVSAEPYIPWELARVPEPWEPESAPYLGAQTRMGRWIHHRRSRTPEALVTGTGFAVVKGVYRGGGRLPEAELEADDLNRDYGAFVLPALAKPVADCLQGSPEATIMHFAVHGQVDAAGPRDGILLQNGDYFAPEAVRGLERTGVRIVVLNACQVGQGLSMLGNYAGMAQAFLAIGASAVVAPLWKVDDTVARRVARDLYDVLAVGGSPAEFFAAERTRADRPDSAGGSTSLAYLYFGHPQLTVAGPFLMKEVPDGHRDDRAGRPDDGRVGGDPLAGGDGPGERGAADRQGAELDPG